MNDPQGPHGGEVSVGTAALPPLHNAWLAALTGVEDAPTERRSTCADCVMCGGVERSGTRLRFSPNVKCCTYVPHLANFLVGRSLAGPGRPSILTRIARRAGVTPLALGLSHAGIRRVVAAQAHFGRAPVVVCPHFVEETRGCAIWQTRNAVCSTWFCKHERGAVSQRFWHAVRDLLIAVEERVSEHCLVECGLPDDQVRAVLGHRAALRERVARANAGDARPDTTVDDESAGWYARMWGDWAGREVDWFVRCAEVVANLDHDGLISLMAGARELSQAVQDRWRDLGVRAVPDRLTFSPRAGSEATSEVLRLVGYSPFDPLVVPATLQAQLSRLDGRPRAQARDGIEPLDRGLLVDLHDFEIAVPPDA